MAYNYIIKLVDKYFVSILHKCLEVNLSIMNSSEPVVATYPKLNLCRRKGHEALPCNRMCLHSSCLPEWICPECVLLFHLEHVKDCVSVESIQKRWAANCLQQDTTYKHDIKLLEDKSIWMHNRLNSFIQNSQRRISNSQQDINDLFDHLTNGNIVQIHSENLRFLKDFLNGKNVNDNDYTHQFKQISASVSFNLDKIISILKMFEDSLNQKTKSTSSQKVTGEDEKGNAVQLVCQINREELKNKYKRKYRTKEGSGSRRILRSNSNPSSEGHKEKAKLQLKRIKQRRERKQKQDSDIKEIIQLPRDLLDCDQLIKKVRS